MVTSFHGPTAYVNLTRDRLAEKCMHLSPGAGTGMHRDVSGYENPVQREKTNDIWPRPLFLDTHPRTIGRLHCGVQAAEAWIL